MCQSNHPSPWFGLGASGFTTPEHGERHSARIESGMVFVNGVVAVDARLPFGGIKRSRHGRELSDFWIREFVNVETGWVGPAH